MKIVDITLYSLLLSAIIHLTAAVFCDNDPNSQYTFQRRNGMRDTRTCNWFRTHRKCGDFDYLNNQMVWETCPIECYERSGCTVCKNDPKTQYTFQRRNGTRDTRTCNWFRTHRKCGDFDFLNNQMVWETCPIECQQRSRSAPLPPSASSPTPNNPAPGLTPAPVGTNFGDFPPGPYISRSQNSERVTLPEPPVPSSFNVNGDCPHRHSGLVRWSQFLPNPSWGQDVTLPSNTRVWIDQTVPTQLGVVTIPSGSELIMGSDGQPVSLDVSGMKVQGRLTAGSESCRLQSDQKVTITLHGSRPSDAVTNRREASYKGIDVDGGTISFHGERFFHTWSRLAKTVDSSFPKVLMLQDPVNWEPGQQVVIVTSAIKDSIDYNQNEVRTIEAVHTSPPAGVGAIVYLTQPVQFRHIANSNYQVEVGLLTRSIVVQGASDSEPTDTDPLNCQTPLDNWWWIQTYDTQPCEDKELTGFGGHIIVHNNGKGFVEGVELYRMGQTNVLGRYPMHFHLLDECPECYIRDSSIHRSFYRCVSIHGTNAATVTENVAYDVRGYCYYLEDGVEERNTISFNLAAHIHMIGPIPWGYGGQTTEIFEESSTLTLPADVTASGYYITNVHNNLIGNAASGGWAGFAFPNLAEALGPHRNQQPFRPSTVTSLTLDGNSAHSSGWWWEHASAFYFGGSLYFNSQNNLEYNPGRSSNFERDDRDTCVIKNCMPNVGGPCNWFCPIDDRDWVRLTNSKAFLTAGSGLNSWSGRMEVLGFESHDARLAIESLSGGFWIKNLLAVCRTGEDLGKPTATLDNRMEGNGFIWYDTDMEHIITESTFRNCGYRSDQYAQYDNSPTRGCDESDNTNGCYSGSSVFSFLTHSDQFTPEIMQGTRDITFENCGRRFLFTSDSLETVSGRGQSWLDVDGSVSGLGVASVIASGLGLAKDWWGVDDDVVYEPQAPLRFINLESGPKRSVGHTRFAWDDSLHSQVGWPMCRNDGSGENCEAVGYVRHIGRKFSPNINGNVNDGLPITANPDTVGMIGGYGWLLKLDGGAPRTLTLNDIEVDPDSFLLLHVAYPVGTTFRVTVKPPEWCWEDNGYTCNYEMQSASSVQEVRDGLGSKYYVSPSGVLTIRVVQFSDEYTGSPNSSWVFQNFDTPGKYKSKALMKFERDGVLLPDFYYHNSISIEAFNCGGTGPYCTNSVPDYDPDVCESGYIQMAYDRCCQASNTSRCVFADGSRNF